EAAVVAMATELNLDLLADLGFSVDPRPGTEDLVVAIRASDEVVGRALDAVRAAPLAVAPPPGTTDAPPASVKGARADVALIAVRGEHAFVEAMAALEAG